MPDQLSCWLSFFFFFLISNYLAVFLKHFDGGKKSRIISDVLEIRLNPATYSGEKSTFFVGSTSKNSKAKLYCQSCNKTSSIVLLKHFTYFASYL